MRSYPVAAALLVLGGATLALAGDLNPPAGPIAPTPGPEPRTPIDAVHTPGDADSIYRISAPGSYYLTGNVTGMAAKHGIEIASSGVTVDLMGFEMVGVAGSLDGVSMTAAGRTEIEVRNGTVRGWGQDGVDLGTLSSTSTIVEGIRAGSNGQFGVYTGSNSRVMNCVASANAVDGITTESSSTVSGCASVGNTGDGYQLNGSCTIAECSATSNVGGGIRVGAASVVTHCNVINSGGDGITVGISCLVSECTSYSNDGNGITTTNGACHFVNCVSVSNGLDGIRSIGNSTILNNTCNSNGIAAATGAGIHVTSTDNRIEGNTCTDADRGIDVDVLGNIIVRNTCSGNTVDWDIVANNVFGPIIDRRVPASAAVSGFSAASTLGSTDANANYSY